jgi:acyl dehydratase
MNASAQSAELPAYHVRTHNASEQSENRMHSDEVARQFGFKAALVPGVTVFAHMTRPLVERHGEEWLGKGIAEVSFFKPAYEGDLLTVASRVVAASTDRQESVDSRLRMNEVALTCTNEEGAELARMTSYIPASSPVVDPRSALAPAPPIAERPLVSWDLIEIGKPFPALRWAPTAADNAQWCADVRDDLALYRTGDDAPIHPGFVLRQANYVLRNRFTLPAWIHTGSRILFRYVLRIGREYEVRAIPEEKWERKGHQFVRLYVAIRSGGETFAEIAHTAIIRPRSNG